MEGVCALFNKTEPSQSLLFYIGKRGSTPADLPSHVIVFPDLLSITSYAALSWDIRNPCLKDSFGELIKNVDHLATVKIAFIATAEEKYVIDLPVGPARYPIIGNVPQLLPYPSLAFQELAKKYGHFFPIFKFSTKAYVVGDARLIGELNEKTDSFGKNIANDVFTQLRYLGGEGLFTTADNEEAWGIAHRILMPSFSAKAIKICIPELENQARKLLNVWKQHVDEDVDVLFWTTKVTIDSISICGFSHDFGSLDRNDEHPFISKLGYCLEEVVKETFRTSLNKPFHQKEREEFFANIEYMKKVCSEIVENRIQEKKEGKKTNRTKDYLDLMLQETDPKTGKKMSSSVIIDNLITFLIAGHDTTASLLCWTLYLLCIHPSVHQRVRMEVDEACGETFRNGGQLGEIEVSKLKYTLQCIKESLRIYPSVGAYVKTCYNDDTLGGMPIRKGDNLLISVFALHNSHVYWGPEPGKFNPDNFSPENEAKRHPNAYAPFGTGERACLGTQFALLEARIVVAYLVHYLDIVVSPNSVPRIIQKTAMKPDNLFLRVSERKSFEMLKSPVVKATTEPSTPVSPKKVSVSLKKASGGIPKVQILWGGNMGTSMGLASSLLSEFTKARLSADLNSLDEFADGSLAKSNLVIIISSTYNGLPPDNAKQFSKWLEANSLSKDLLRSVRFAIFGVGNTQWLKTYQAFPKKLDNHIEKMGGIRILERGEGNVDEGFDIEETFESWKSKLWDSFEQVYSFTGSKVSLFTQDVEEKIIKVIPAPLDADPPKIPMCNPKAKALRVTCAKELQAGGSDKSTKHIEVNIEGEYTYETGDHFAIYPENSSADIEAIIDQIILPEGIASIDSPLILIAALGTTGKDFGYLPLNSVTNVRLILRHIIDLHAVPTRSIITKLSNFTDCPPEVAQLNELAKDNYAQHITACRRSILWVLKKFKSIQVPFDQLVTIVPVIQPRLYSIASSSIVYSKSVHLSVSVVDNPSKKPEIESSNYLGFCSNFIKGLEEGSKLVGYVKNHGSAFHLPADSARPIVMVGAGTGLAPFRGFIQERHYKKKIGNAVGSSVLIFGCRRADQDELYANEIQDFLTSGSLSKKFTAYSRQPGAPKCYVQNKLLEEECKDQVWKLINEENAIFYICGEASEMAKGVRESFVKIIQEKLKLSEQESWNHLDKLLNEKRYVEDVWG